MREEHPGKAPLCKATPALYTDGEFLLHPLQVHSGEAFSSDPEGTPLQFNLLTCSHRPEQLVLVPNSLLAGVTFCTGLA